MVEVCSHEPVAFVFRLTICNIGIILHHSQERDLEDAFRRFGRVRSVWVARNPPGFAYVVRRSASTAVDGSVASASQLAGDNFVRQHLLLFQQWSRKR